MYIVLVLINSKSERFMDSSKPVTEALRLWALIVFTGIYKLRKWRSGTCLRYLCSDTSVFNWCSQLSRFRRRYGVVLWTTEERVFLPDVYWYLGMIPSNKRLQWVIGSQTETNMINTSDKEVNVMKKDEQVNYSGMMTNLSAITGLRVSE